MTKPPLYRKVNTRTHGVQHRTGGDYRHERHLTAPSHLHLHRHLHTGSDAEELPVTPSASMHGKHRRGLDYTPLFRFLLKSVGRPWDQVFSEAVARLDRKDPIFWLVARSDVEQRECVRIGESTYYSGLYVDANGLLQRVNPALKAEDLQPACTCCTHTFNGVRFPDTDGQSSPPAPSSPPSAAPEP